MNVVEKFRDWMVSESITTSGQIKIHRASAGTKSPDELWWLKAEGGSDLGQMVTGESIQTSVIGVYYRNRSARDVYNFLEVLRDAVVCAGCLVLDGYKVVTIPTTQGPFVDQDIDNEERTIGYLQVTITTKKEC